MRGSAPSVGPLTSTLPLGNVGDDGYSVDGFLNDVSVLRLALLACSCYLGYNMA